MHDLLFSIKQAAVDAVQASKPVQIAYGTVVSPSPLCVRLEQKTVLDSKFLTTLGQTFESGDSLVLLREQGGQGYLVLGKKGRA